jgi:peptidyl-prolyl cis-trans isomerase D
MLESIRGATKSWLGKAVLTVLFTFLIFSFAIWGIGDIFKGYGTNTLAKIGGTEIGVETYRRAYQQRIYEVQQRNRGFTNEQARQVGLDKQVLNQMLGEAALNETSRKLGLGLSDDDVAKFVTNQPALKGSDSKFSRILFDNMIREAGLSEGAFIQQQKQLMLRLQLSEALTGGLSAPNALLEMIQRYQNEERSISYVVMPGAIAAALPAPDEETLKAFHEQRKAMFRAPAFRKVQLTSVSPAEFAGDVVVTDKDLQDAYDRALGAGRYGTPEKRRIQQILFPDTASATAAFERIKAGATFDAVAEERKLALADIDLGEKTKAELADRAVADAAFAAVLNGVSAPIQGQFGSVLLRVTGITPGETQSFANVKEALRTDFTQQRIANDRGIRAKIDAVHDRIEELRSSGKSLDQVVKEINRPITIIESVNAQGVGKDGNPVSGLPAPADTLKAIFQSDRGVDNEAIRTRDNGYIWFEILEIDAARERSFDEVKAQVTESWRNDEASRISAERANEFLKRAEGGVALDVLATELGSTVEKADGFTRNGNTQINGSVAASAFALGSNGFAIAATGRGSDRMIMKVDAAVLPAYDPNAVGVKALKGQIDTTISEEILSLYVNNVQNGLGVTVNDRALLLATGGQQQR